MWLLENEGVFQGRRLWLRPGKTYLFGRTAAEPGQLSISHNTISRKHLTITIEAVKESQVHHATSRPNAIIEDLATKIGTVVNGQRIKGDKYIAESENCVDITMGKCPSSFRLIYNPVVLTFSFTSKELQTDPLTILRERFQTLDIKLLVDYNIEHTTHVVSKKRNTAKGLQALINGKYIVTESYLDAISQVCQSTLLDNGAETCELEQDFDKYWPDPMDHLPPRGSEPTAHADSIYAPEDARKDVFEGYSFIFYDQNQYNNLLAPITNGGGKALLENVIPNTTTVDDFVRYVKSVAGEKGLGRFEDGSEGKGVVVVRYIPAKGDHVPWFADFFTQVSLRLDHRPIEQNEFLEAILIKDATMLRRPLQVEDSEGQQPPLATTSASQPSAEPTSIDDSNSAALEPTTARKLRGRAPVKRRFAGFDDASDIDMDEIPLAPPRETATTSAEDGLFVSQQASYPDQDDEDGDMHISTRQQRKRPASAIQEDEIMEDMAPAAARLKRQRIERGETLDTAEPDSPAPAAPKAVPKKKKKELDILAVAAKNREEQEARARAEKEDLANLPDDIDLAEIRRFNIVEEIEIRPQTRTERTREQDVVDGRWDPKWNGIKNFKKFRKRGEVTGRQPARVIIQLAEAKNKEFGVGDAYWLEDASGRPNSRSGRNHSQQSSIPSQSMSLSGRSGIRNSNSNTMANTTAANGSSSSNNNNNNSRNTDNYNSNRSVDNTNDHLGEGSVPSVQVPGTVEDDVLDEDTQPPHTGSRSSRSRISQTQSSRFSQPTGPTRSNPGKRAAPQGSSATQNSKRPKNGSRIAPERDSDDSDEEVGFKFGRRR